MEFNRRKNVNQDQRLDTVSSQVAELLAQEPAGYLPEVFYGLTRGNQTYRFNLDYIFNVTGLEGAIGDSYEIYDESQSEAYIPAIAVQTNETTLKVIIQGDYPAYGEELKVVNMKTGDDYSVTLSGGMLLQDASYLGAFDADDYQNKQITVLHDLTSNKDNVLFCSIDLNSDGDYNWISIGSFTNGADGKCVYSMNTSNQTAITNLLKAGDSLVIGENMTISGDSYLLGDVLTVDTINPLTLTKISNIRGPQGETGSTGPSGADGEDGATPTIVDGYWYINGVSTGVKAVGTDGTDGQNGQSFQTQSGLYSVPANQGQTGNVDPDGNALLTLPTLPTTGITGKGYVVFDPLTTPLQPYYDLYWANDGDNDWTIIHPFSGINGQDGTDGETPYIGANGHWWTGTTDSGVSATGPQGPAGPAGIATYEGTSTEPVVLKTILDNMSVGTWFFVKGYYKANSTSTTVYNPAYPLLFYYTRYRSNYNEYDIMVFGGQLTGTSSINFDSNFYMNSAFFTTSSNTVTLSISRKYIELAATLSGTQGTAITTNNTTAFTPTADYHPATKKYVDDAVAGAGGGSSLYRHHLEVIGDNNYFGLWCEIVNTSSAVIQNMAGFTAAVYNAGYREAQGSYAPGELMCRGWKVTSNVAYQLLSISSSNGTAIRFNYMTNVSNSSYLNTFATSNDTGPVGTVYDIVTQIS